MSCIARKPLLAYAKTKAQISCAVTAQLISTFVFLCIHVDSTIPLSYKFERSWHLTISCGWTAWFVSDLVRNPNERVYRDGAHIISPDFEKCECHILLKLDSNVISPQQL